MEVLRLTGDLKIEIYSKKGTGVGR